ncbi:glycosyltransferase [Caulobacter sp. S45]|uniref:glycosyltransferase n=1 Tax=Caulobacter sp. S45 TaxID=1641861 RepID=UPI001C2D4C69|nr:glycosyltransferase [Caulobacter sp. S45]
MSGAELVLTTIAGLGLLIWLYLLLGRGMFWLARERDDRQEPAEPSRWPSVVAVMPARDEADVIARSIGSLLAQDYPGEFRVVLVDDQSGDDTGKIARALPGAERLEVLAGSPLPRGWVGKMWAVHQGVAHASRSAPDYVLLTDADIGHQTVNLRKLVARAEAGRLVLVSLMVRLHCKTRAERLLIPAFVFFFDMLFPFGWVNNPKRKLAAGAGGCMLVRRQALEAAGGVGEIKDAIIDDCALAGRLKAQGPVWLGLTLRAESLRPYAGFAEVAQMVSRSAYAQLGYSPWLLAGTVLGMALTYLAPAMLALSLHGLAAAVGAMTWLLMAISFQPMLRLYRLSPLWGLALPLIGLLYTAFTLQSAVQVWSGKGGMWKGRAQAEAHLEAMEAAE